MFGFLSREFWRKFNEIHNLLTTKIKGKSLSKFSSNCHLKSKNDWHKNDKFWLNHFTIEKEVTLQNIDTIKKSITSKFKKKLKYHKEIKVKEIKLL